MKKYFLTVINEANFMHQDAIDISMAIGEIVDSKYMNFNFGENYLMFHFESSVNKEDMYTFIQGVLYGITDTFVLTEISDNFSVSLPAKMKFIFDLDRVEDIVEIDKTSNDYDMVEYGDEDDEYDELYQNIMENYRQNLKKSQPKISLDSLLDKIKEKGLDSLSDVEKQILESYSK